MNTSDIVTKCVNMKSTFKCLSRERLLFFFQRSIFFLFPRLPTRPYTITHTSQMEKKKTGQERCPEISIEYINFNKIISNYLTHFVSSFAANDSNSSFHFENSNIGHWKQLAHVRQNAVKTSLQIQSDTRLLLRHLYR